MSHDNARFNVSGETIEGLEAALNLWALIHEYGHSMKFVGYSLHPQYGMVLYTYEQEDANIMSFPFNEGKNARQLATFFFNYLESDKSVVNDEFSDEPYMHSTDKERMTYEFKWDYDSDHDGSNVRGWRVLTGTWGHVLGYAAPLAIRPIYCWHGK